ncbi:MAG: hypothetical protein D6732_14285 [Methanobacteriota archaeon]|nr:MAG: hypothetical protein D6732_14285 [Euryarchaeota archaeon]
MASLMDYIIENPAELPKNGSHYIPLIYIAKRYLFYYFPTVYPEQVKQGTSKNQEIQKEIKEKLGKTGPKEMEYVVTIRDLIETGEELPENLVRLLLRIRQIIIDQPLKYIKSRENQLNEDIKGTNIKLKEEQFTLFGLTNTKTGEPFNYEKARENAQWQEKRTAQTFQELEAAEFCYISLGAYTYRELTKYRYFLKDAILKRWIEKTREYLEKENSNVFQGLNQFIKGLSIINKDPDRDNAFIQKFRNALFKHQKDITCIYCNRPLSKETIEIDHFIPWSKLPVNKFWNLFPSCKECNGKKSDRLVEINEKLKSTMKNYLEQLFSLFEQHREYALIFGSKFDQELLDKNKKHENIRIYLERLQEIMETMF